VEGLRCEVGASHGEVAAHVGLELLDGGGVEGGFERVLAVGAVARVVL
jgi:hypothetical protein